MEILIYPDKRLRNKAAPVAEITDEIREKARGLLNLMYDEGGIGLAATQVGWDARVFVINVTQKPEDELVLVNPEIVEKSGGLWSFEEACLSLPGISGKVKRERNVVVRAQNLDGEEFELEADGLVARCILHEYDHLEGRLFIDRLSTVRKLAAKRKLKV